MCVSSGSPAAKDDAIEESPLFGELTGNSREGGAGTLGLGVCKSAPHHSHLEVSMLSSTDCWEHSPRHEMKSGHTPYTPIQILDFRLIKHLAGGAKDEDEAAAQPN